MTRAGLTSEERQRTVTHEIEKDPVCGMAVHPASSNGGSVEHAGTTYFFCNPRCRAKFSGAPQAYLEAAPQVALAPSDATAEAGTIGTCPMHPEVRQSTRGSCPICGMAIEPSIAVKPTTAFIPPGAAPR